MSNRLRICPIQAYFRSYVKHCYLSHKFTTPRECPPGPLQRLLTKNRCNRNMAGTTLRSNRPNRNSNKRVISISRPATLKDKHNGNVKFDFVKIEPVANTGSYCQILVTLKKMKGEDGRDQWVREIRTAKGMNGNKDYCSLSGNVYQDPNALQKITKDDSHMKPTNRCLDLDCILEGQPNNLASCQRDLRKTIESITILFHTASERVRQQYDQNEVNPIVSKLRNNDRKPRICLEQQIKEYNDVLDDEIEREMTIQMIKGQIYHKSEQSSKLYKELTESVQQSSESLPPSIEANGDYAEVVMSSSPIEAHKGCAKLVTSSRAAEAIGDCTAIMMSSSPIEDHQACAGILTSAEVTEANRDCIEGNLQSSTGSEKRPYVPKIHIKIQGSIIVKRNSLGNLVGTYRKKTSTKIPRGDGRPKDVSSI